MENRINKYLDINLPMYVIFYYDYQIIVRTLKYLKQIKNRYKNLEIIAIENNSENSFLISNYIKDYLNNGIISRYYYFNKNISNNAFEQVLNKERKYLSKYQYVIITDGDLIVNNYSFINELHHIINLNEDFIGVAVSLDYRNLPIETFPEAYQWAKIDKKICEEYIEGGAGIWFMMIKRHFLIKFLNHILKNNLSFNDSNLSLYSYLNKKSILKTKNSRAIHLTWYRYQDINHPYTKFKIKNINKIWNHKKYLPYCKLFKKDFEKKITFFNFIIFKYFTYIVGKLINH